MLLKWKYAIIINKNKKQYHFVLKPDMVKAGIATKATVSPKDQ